MPYINRLVTLLLVCGLWLSVFAQTPTPVALTVGQTLEKTLNDGATHSYLVNAAAGQYFRLAIEQRDLDLKLNLAAPDNKPLAEIDFFQAGRAETVVWLAEAAGAYRLEIQPVEKGERGAYQVTLTDLRNPTETDRQRVAAQQAFLAADNLAADDKVTSSLVCRALTLFILSFFFN